MNNSLFIELKKYSVLFFLSMSLAAYGQKFERGIELHTFVPKGEWMVGNSISYSEYNAKNYKFLVVDGFDADGYSFKISPVVAYAVKDNLALGGRFSYVRSFNKIDRLSVSLDDETSFSLEDIYSLTHSYSGCAIMRNYISLGSSQRFALFNEIQLKLGGSQTKLVNGKGNDLVGTYETSMDIGIGLAPGMVAFVNNYTAVELSVGVLGFNYSKTRQKTNQVYIGEHASGSASFRINLFSISLGIAFYL